MSIIIKDESGAFETYVNRILKSDVIKYIKQRKTIVYLPKDLNAIVREKLLSKVKTRSDITSVRMELKSSGTYSFLIEYKEIPTLGQKKVTSKNKKSTDVKSVNK